MRLLSPQGDNCISQRSHSRMFIPSVFGPMGRYLLRLALVSGILSAPLYSQQIASGGSAWRFAPATDPCESDASASYGYRGSPTTPGGSALGDACISPFRAYEQACLNSCCSCPRPRPVADAVFPSGRDFRHGVTPTIRLSGITLAAWNQHNVPEEKQDVPEHKEKKESSSERQKSAGHIFWVIPAFNVSYQKTFKPMTPREKFDEWLDGTYDPRGIGLYAFESATLEHSSTDGFCGYGKGWGNYGKCFGATELDANISAFLGDFLFPVLMHQDPRYFRLGEGSFARRLGYAMSRVLVTHADSGRTVFFASALTGTVVASAASNLYYPPQDRGFRPTVDRVALDLGNTALFNVAAEFWPNIRHAVYRVVGRH
jgi:hypothetical protein